MKMTTVIGKRLWPTWCPLSSHDKLAAGRDSAEVQLARRVSPAL